MRHVYYQLWNRLPVQVWRMRQVLRAGALGWPRGMGWRGRWEEGSVWGTHVNPWLIHINVWQKPLQYYKVISLQTNINKWKVKRPPSPRKRHRCIEQSFGLWERVRAGWYGRKALKHVNYHMWNKSPVQARCMIQDTQGWCTGMTQGDGMGREVGGRLSMGNTCKSMVDSYQCIAKTTTIL